MPTIRETLPEYTVLELLVAGAPMYGLDLVERSEGVLQRGTVYLILATMEDRGLVSSKLDREGADGNLPDVSRRLEYESVPRRLYTVTDRGRRAFDGYKYDIAKLYREGYAASISLQSKPANNSKHWRAGWDAGYRARTLASELVNGYLASIGCAKLETMTLAGAGETDDRSEIEKQAETTGYPVGLPEAIADKCREIDQVVPAWGYVEPGSKPGYAKVEVQVAWPCPPPDESPNSERTGPRDTGADVGPDL